jgi:hypothetical protein
MTGGSGADISTAGAGSAVRAGGSGAWAVGGGAATATRDVCGAMAPEGLWARGFSTGSRGGAAGRRTAVGVGAAATGDDSTGTSLVAGAAVGADATVAAGAAAVDGAAVGGTIALPGVADGGSAGRASTVGSSVR